MDWTSTFPELAADHQDAVRQGIIVFEQFFGNLVVFSEICIPLDKLEISFSCKMFSNI